MYAHDLYVLYFTLQSYCIIRSRIFQCKFVVFDHY